MQNLDNFQTDKRHETDDEKKFFRKVW